ncbi:MAG: class I SAM-dependent methyltransferase [Rhodovibrio sp.]|nr:class I SAM-dependent methyltransferase [Rhodovibrio sp.]
MPRSRALVRAVRRRVSFFRQAECDRLRAILPAGAVLDVGCGKGDRLPDHVIPFGIEISENEWVQAHARMVERGGYAVNAGGVEGLDRFGDESFDGMVMRSYLEHEDQPRAVLDRAYRKLKSGGVVYVRVPNFGSINARVLGPRWCGIRLPDHLNYFTVAQLKGMAEDSGFTVNVLNAWNLAVDDNIKAVLKKPQTSD